jgi:hypothetical protein
MTKHTKKVSKQELTKQYDKYSIMTMYTLLTSTMLSSGPDLEDIDYSCPDC